MKLSYLAGALLLGLAAQTAAQDRPIVIKAGTLIDGKGSVIKNAIIVIQSGKIARVDQSTEPVTYDLSNLTVMPGWIDTHVHIEWHFGLDGKYASSRKETPPQQTLAMMENAYVTLMGGVTTVQSVGSPIDKDLRTFVERGIIPGPRVLTSLRAITDPKMTPEQMREFVRQQVKDGADLVKVFASKSSRQGGGRSLDDAQIQAVCDEARSLGKRVMVHSHDDESARAATLAGCWSIEHGSQVTDETFRLMAQKGTYFTPNVGLVSQNYIENKEKFLGTGSYTEEGLAETARLIPMKHAMFKRALKIAGLKMPLGTDAVAGAHSRNVEEIVGRVHDGQKPMDALVGATSLAAQAIQMEKTIGTIAPGFEADIIALDGDPLTDITAVRRVVFVMKGGKVYKNVAPAVATKTRSNQ